MQNQRRLLHLSEPTAASLEPEELVEGVEGGWWGGHLRQAGLLPQGTRIGGGAGPDAVDLRGARLMLEAESDPGSRGDFHPTGWFTVSVTLPMYVVLVWGGVPHDLDAHMYTTAACRHCGKATMTLFSRWRP